MAQGSGEEKAKGDEIDESTQERCNDGSPAELWEGTVWAAWCKGERNIAALSRQVGKRWNTVRDSIVRLSKIAAATTDGIAPDGEYVAGLELDLRDLERICRLATDGNNMNAAIGAKKQIVDCRAKLAVAKGLITERGEVNVKGKVDHAIVPTARLAEIVAESREYDGDIDGGDEPSAGGSGEE